MVNRLDDLKSWAKVYNILPSKYGNAMAYHESRDVITW